MQNKHISDKLAHSPIFDKKHHPELTLRDRYTLEVQRIRHEYGDLEAIRTSLGLSQRKLCLLLMVDPSAWTRWLKTDAPPVIYRALEWLLQVYKNSPESIDPMKTAQRLDLIQSLTTKKIQQLEAHIQLLESQVGTTNVSVDMPLESLLLQQQQHFAELIQSLKPAKKAKTRRKSKAKKKVTKKKVARKKTVKKKSNKKKTSKKAIKKTAPKKKVKRKVTKRKTIKKATKKVSSKKKASRRKVKT